MNSTNTWTGREYRVAMRLVRILCCNDLSAFHQLDDHDEAALEDFCERVEGRRVGWWVPTDPRGDGAYGKCAVTGELTICEGVTYLVTEQVAA